MEMGNTGDIPGACGTYEELGSAIITTYATIACVRKHSFASNEAFKLAKQALDCFAEKYGLPSTAEMAAHFKTVPEDMERFLAPRERLTDLVALIQQIVPGEVDQGKTEYITDAVKIILNN